MIKQTNARQSSVAAASVRPPVSDGPEIWGQWSGRKHYSLEVVQHPLRARMCGFGDKDRRPLAPAAVTKMIVRREDNTVVDIDDVDSSFFLVTVDLWSGDGKQEMNLVLHPSSADRYAPPNPTSTKSSRRRGTSSSQPRTPGNQAPASSSTPTPTPLSSSPRNPTYFPSQPQDAINTYPPSTQYSPSSTDPPQTWGYPPPAPPVDRATSFPPPILPSIHSFRRSVSGTTAEPWNSENYPIDPALRGASNTENRESSGWNPSAEGYSSAPPASQTDQPAYGSGPYPTSSSNYQANGPYPQAPSGTPPPQTNIPRHIATYTRTLVGPLSANACRLLDEHRKPGIFFLFQDLSVRTEGTFRLRMRLMNVGAPPAPEVGAVRVHNDVSPVLAQTFTESFTVYSAKRFPGVPDTTALSIAFGNQGQKLPLRNRHGTSKRRRRDESESEEDSDES